MRVGFDHYTIAHRALGAEATLDFALERGLEGVQFLDASEIDPALGSSRLAEFRRQAGEAGLYLEVGLPSPNPARRARAEGRPVSIEEHADYLGPFVEGVA